MSWPSVKLEAVSEFIRNGASIKQSNDAAGLPITRIETIAYRTVNLDKCGYANVSEVEYLNYRLRNGDILISHINSEKHLAKCAIFESDRGDVVHGMNLLCLRPSCEVVFSKYLFHYLSSSVFLRLIPAITKKSVNQASFTVTAFKDLEIPLPPLPEQKRIAAILDKADAIRRKRQQAIQLADDFLRAVFLDMFGDPVTNPKGWNVVELSTLVDPDDKLNYGVVQPGDHEEDGVPLVRSGDLSDVTPDVSQLRRVSASIDSKHRKSKLKGNEILIACVGTIGRVGWVSDAMIGWNIARAVTRIPIREGVNREYVYRYLQNPVVQGYFERETRAVAQPTLNVGLIAKTPVALPPHDLQIAFLERYRTIQAYKERLLVALGAQDELAGCLSQRAFAGQL
ncbi:restriction endonuclease subunit S [Pseudomonas aeruginosa]|uniref:restriction endonuclease subunit S n=1 Tax=Pseudomonas aeruginosa TaxID=287 RepID=UPI0009A38B92|nr:restriction endonuclease subunit S [Pseudomonas aeruginosa]EIZ0544643.1 restriction endonuclease subunit S [Pseudomonas aeruginosa]EKV4131778.1 restriction endonuclease subunit S [Pseudomonas aeruginosa]EKW0412930.1 restriction endonuclease subunit S [Pseudomonas aeruginosa]EKW1422087.1 restriction endonuclease subunit S [Pseudomonas aeruginosa]EKW1536022.1 restriction endonuclease subunit S [Pseudomonas aeruginosa]